MAASSASVHSSLDSVYLTFAWKGPYQVGDLAIQSVQLVFFKPSQYVSVNVIQMKVNKHKFLYRFSCRMDQNSNASYTDEMEKFPTSVQALNKLGIRIILGNSYSDDPTQERQLTVEQPGQGLLPNCDYMLVISTREGVTAKLVPSPRVDRSRAVQVQTAEDEEAAKQTIRQIFEVIPRCVEYIAPKYSSLLCEMIDSQDLRALMQSITNIGANNVIPKDIPELFAQWLVKTSGQVCGALKYNIDASASKGGNRNNFEQTPELAPSVVFLQMLCKRFFSLTEKKQVLPQDIEAIKLYAAALSGALESQALSYLQAQLRASGIECGDMSSLEEQVKIATQASIKSLQILIQTVLTLRNLMEGRTSIKNKDLKPLVDFFREVQNDMPGHQSLMQINPPSTSVEEIQTSLDLVQKKHKTILEVIVTCIEEIAWVYKAQAASEIKALGVKAIEAFMQNLGAIEVKRFLEPILSHWLSMTFQKVLEDLQEEDLEPDAFKKKEFLGKWMNPEVIAKIQQVFNQLEEIVKQPLINSMHIQGFQKTLAPFFEILKKLCVSYCKEYMPNSKENAEFATSLTIVAEQESKAFMQCLQIITSMSLALLSLWQKKSEQTLLATDMKLLETLWEQFKASTEDDDNLQWMFARNLF